MAPDGSSLRVSYGLLNLTHRDGHEQPKPLEPGRWYQVRLQLNDIAHAFPAGHRIRLAVSTSYWPRVWPSPEPVTLTLYTGTSRLRLPVRTPRAEDASLADFAEPESAPPGAHRVLSPARRARVLKQDVATGQTVVETVKDRGRAHLQDIDLTIGAAATDRYALMGDDPLSARHENAYRVAMERGDWKVRTEADTVMTCTKEDFLLSARLDAYEGDTRIFSRSWSRRIPRDGT